ncbi:FecR domain-containing protein, partial [Chloroflexota bacterium]
MANKLVKTLDECITRINQGETIETCLTQYAHIRGEIEPLLRTALSVKTMPKLVPSDEFRKTSKALLLLKLRREAEQAQAAKSGLRIPLLDELAIAGQSLLRALAPLKKVVIPVTLVMLLALGTSLGAFHFMSPSPALASQCTLSLLSGSAEILETSSANWKQGADGMTLAAGMQVKTSHDSHAVLTFFEGSTIRLEPGTNVEIQQLEYDDEQAVTIILKQWTGRTWSRVVKMASPGSRYEIETPSATAIVRGTLFTTEIDETGSTKVATTEGLVSVVAQDEEVYLPANQRTEITPGQSPLAAKATPDPEAKILVRVDTPVIATVIDPTGASTGYMPDGLSVNQVIGSQSTSTDEGTQVITLPQPTSGEYTVALRYTGEGKARFNIQGRSKGETAFEYAGTSEGMNGSGWLIRFNLQVKDGLIVNSSISGMEPIGDNAPEKIVKAEMPKQKSGTFQTTDQNEDDNQPGAGAVNSNSNQAKEDTNAGQTDDPGRGKQLQDEDGSNIFTPQFVTPQDLNSKPDESPDPDQGNQLGQKDNQSQNDKPDQ